MRLGTLGFFLRWSYLSNSPIFPSITVPNHSHNNFNVNYLEAIFLCVSGATVIYIHANMTSCVNVPVVFPLARVLLDGGLSSSWVV